MKNKRIKKMCMILLCCCGIVSLYQKMSIHAYADVQSVQEELSPLQNNNAPAEHTTTKQNINSIEDKDVPDPSQTGEKSSENDSLFATIKKGGPLMILLLLMGFIALTLIIERAIFFSKEKAWHKNSLIQKLREKADNSSATYREDLIDELNEHVNLYMKRLERGLAFLSGIGNLAPLTGFLGTVVGMISAFASIAAATTVNAKIVAVGIQIALVTTAGGLIVAVPTLGFYYLYIHIIQNRLENAEESIAEITTHHPRMSTTFSIEKGIVSNV